MSSGLPRKRTVKVQSTPSQAEGGAVQLYAAAGIVGLTIITLVAIYVMWPSASKIASFSADKIWHSSVLDIAHELITAALDVELGNGNWADLGFEGPFPGEPIRIQVVEQLANGPGVDDFVKPDTGACVARILINVRQTSGKRPGRAFRLYWVNSDRTARHIVQEDPAFAPIMTAFAEALSASRKK